MFCVAPFGVPSTAQGQIYELVGKIENPKGLPAGSGDNFGFSMAAVGDNLMIAAFEEDTGALNAGTVYLYDRQGNLLNTIRNPEPVENGRFGRDMVAVGENILIGAQFNDGGGPNSGAAYLYDQQGNLLQKFNNPSPDPDDRFGGQVATLQGDVLIGAIFDASEGVDAGRIYRFDQQGNLLDTITNPLVGDTTVFSRQIATSDEFILTDTFGTSLNSIGGGTAQLFDSEGELVQTFFNPSVDATNFFGFDLELVGDKVVVGAYFDDSVERGLEAGIAYIFNQDGTLEVTLENPTPEHRDWFGRNIKAVNDDLFFVSAIFDNTGAPITGSTYLYNLQGELLQTINNPTPGFNEHFGNGIEIIGEDVFISANFDGNFGGGNVNGPGAVYIYTSVPEPSTLLLGVVGLAGLMIYTCIKSGVKRHTAA